MATETLIAPVQTDVDPIEALKAEFAPRWMHFEMEADAAEHYAAYAPWAPADMAGSSAA